MFFREDHICHFPLLPQLHQLFQLFYDFCNSFIQSRWPHSVIHLPQAFVYDSLGVDAVWIGGGRSSPPSCYPEQSRLSLSTPHSYQWWLPRSIWDVETYADQGVKTRGSPVAWYSPQCYYVGWSTDSSTRHKRPADRDCVDLIKLGIQVACDCKGTTD